MKETGRISFFPFNRLRLLMNLHLPGFVKTILFFLILVFSITPQSKAQKYTTATGVEIEINSGNPAFPFPQFLPYKKGKNLGTHQVPGLTHADMEKTIKEGWAIMMNRAKYTGESAGDAPGKKVKYIIFNPVGMDGAGPQPFCSEGDGYALVAAALMADKTAFDGLYMAIHDYKFKKVKRYLDCAGQGMKYKINPLPGVYDRKIDDVPVDETSGHSSDGGTHDSAADGDWDIGMGLVLAARQWGDKSGIYVCGKEINYRQEALTFMRALTDTLRSYFDIGTPNERFNGMYYTGDIGLDGYAKGGNTFPELTGWANNTNLGKPYFSGPGANYFDYMGSGYFQVFAQFLEEEKAKTGTAQYDWAISQFKRARASTNWLLENVLKDGYLPYIGKVSMSTGKPEFSFFSEGEDFRLIWRNLADAIWHGQPEYIWDPVNHKIIPGTTDMLDKHAKNVTDHFNKPSVRSGEVCPQLGMFPGKFATFDGPMVIGQGIDKSGLPVGGLPQTRGMNWIQGTSSAAPVISEDINLAAYMYQQCEIEWDATVELTGPAGKLKTDERYIKSTPKYFHEFFRLLGLLTLTGNYYPPNDIKPIANVKTYVSIDKTYGFPGDVVKYVVKYRNYGSADAKNVSVKFTIPQAFTFVSSTKGSGSANVVTWNIATVPGFKTGAEAATMDSMVVTVKVAADAQNGRYCATSVVSGTNFESFTSNEYPNNASYTMERNCFDVVTRSLVITKTADREAVNPGDRITYKVTFENSSKAGWLDGGRPGVKFTYGQHYYGNPDAVTKFDVFLRIMHGAHEAYVNLKNYRVSYFVNETAIDKVVTDKTQLGWFLYSYPYYQGDDNDKMVLANQLMPYGQDAAGKKWNQRLIFKFTEDVISAPTNHLFLQTNNFHRIHKGTGYPFIAYLQIETKGLSLNYSDDWSFDTKNNAENEKDANVSLVLPDNSDPAVKDDMSMKVHTYGCGNITKYTDRILVEEFDGYGWRRVLGTGPFAGREAAMVVVVDTLPKEVKWGGFNRSTAVGVEATYDPACHCVTWKKDALLVAEKGTLEYWVTTKNASEMGKVCPIELDAKNRAWISAESESPLYSEVITHITCGQLPPPKPAKTTMTKLADKASYKVADEVFYVIGYKQTQGTIADPDLKSNADWVVTGTVNFSNGAVKFASAKEYIQNDYSHGTNGKFTFEIEITNASNLFSLVFRNTGGNTPDGVGIQVHPGPWGMDQGAVIAIMNGSTNVMQTDGFKPYGATSALGKMKFDIYLHSDTMDVWLNKDPESDAPTLSATNLKIKAGYIGFYNSILGSFKKVNNNDVSGDGGNQIKITNWYSHFDSAFDVKIQDPMPDGLTYNDNSAKKLFTSAGFVPQAAAPVYNAVTKTIEWILASGKKPMLANDSVAFQFSGKVNGCPTKFLTNIAYANMLGQAINKIGAQSTAECKVLAGCDPPTSVTVATPDGKVICNGKIKLNATALPANAEYYYTWYKGSEVYKLAAQNQTSIEVTDAGDYYVSVSTTPEDPECSKESEKITVTVNPVNAGEIAADQIVCAGETALPFTSIKAASGGSGTTYSYQWYYSIDKTNWVKITNATLPGYNRTAPVTETLYFLREASQTGCKSDSTPAVTVTMTQGLPAPRASADPVCLGEALRLYTDAVPSATYEWKLNNTLKSSDQNPVLMNADAAMSGDYYVRVKVGNCFSPATKVTVAVKTKPVITTVDNNNPCVGQALNMIASGGSQTATFSWTGPGGFTAAGRAVTRDPFEAAMAGDYTVTATENGCTSIPYDLSVSAGTGPAKPQVSSTPACYGNILTIRATGTPGAEYNWTGPDGFIGSGADLNIPSATPAISGKYIVTASVDGCNSDTASVNALVYPELKPGIISAEQTICSGETPEELTGTEATGGSGNYTYQWQKRVSGTTPWAGIQNENGISYQPGPLTQATEFRRNVTSGTCGTVSSEFVKISISSSITPSAEIAIKDNKLPDICQKDSLTFVIKSVAGAGKDPEYQWMKNNSEIPGADKDTLKIKALSDHDKISLLVKNLSSCATARTVTSQEIEIKITPSVTADVEIASVPAGPVCENTPVKFGIIRRQHLGDAPLFQWLNRGNEISGANDSVYTLTTPADIDLISLRVQSNERCVTEKTVTSAPVGLIIGKKPSVVVKSVVKQFCPGDSIELSAELTPSVNVTAFDWKRGNVSLPAASNNKSVIKAGQAGVYSVTVKTAEGCEVKSDDYSIEELVLPPVSVTPSTSVICSGISPVLKANPSDANLQYKWLDENDNEVAASGAEYQPSSAGNYRVIASYGVCKDTSVAVSVTEKNVVKPVIGGKETVSCEEAGVAYNVTAANGSKYLWTLPAGAIITSSDKQAPSVTVSFGETSGDISVMEVTAEGCSSEVALKPVSVTGCNLRPDFEFTPVSGCIGQAVTFTDRSTGTTAATEYSWDFGQNALPADAADAGPHDVIYNTAGEYQVTLTLKEGEISREKKLTLKINPAAVITPVKDIFCKGVQAQLETPSLTSATGYAWINEGGNVVSSEGPVFKPVTEGRYRVIVNYGSCRDTSEEVYVAQKEVAVPEIGGKNAVYCEEESVEYNVAMNAGSVYKWTLPAGATIVSSETEAAMVDVNFGNKGGTVSVIEITAEGCSSEVATFPVEMLGCDLNPQFTFEPEVACLNTPVVFTNSTTGFSATTVYSWDFGSAADPAGTEEEGPVSVVFSTPGTYNVTLTASEGGFSRSVTKTVKVAGPAVVTGIDGIASVCRNNTAVYTAAQNNSDYTYNWIVTNGEIKAGQGTASVIVEFGAEGTGEVKLVYGLVAGCTETDTVAKEVSVMGTPQIDLTLSSPVLCRNTVVTMKATSGLGSYTWFVNDQRIQGAAGITYVAREPGRYQVIAGPANCASKSAMTELRGDNFIIDAGPDQQIEAGTSTRIVTTANEKVLKYLWTPATVTPVAEPTVLPLVTTTYIVKALGENGCYAQDTVIINVVRPLFIPNAFTPNGDQVHDIWEIRGLEQYDNFEIEIFNRWGARVHTAKNVTTTGGGVWDGTFNGDLLPVSTYYYVLKLKKNGETSTESGSVLLSR
jgi:gliding motility-associated-like protein/uncharacterized repeat protein (TIGR01451 family)